MTVKPDKWTGSLDDACSLRTEDGYIAHCECMGNEGGSEDWVIIVDMPDGYQWHSCERDVMGLSGPGARGLAELVIDADRGER